MGRRYTVAARQETARLLRRMMVARGVTQEALAKRLRMSRPAVNRWCCGERSVSLPLLRRIGTVLGYTVVVTVTPTDSGSRTRTGGSK